MSRVQHISTRIPDRPKPVFFDKSGRRWRRCLATISAVATIVLAGAGLFVASLFYDPRFPGIKIDDADLLRQDEQNDQVGVEGTLVKTPFTEEKAPFPNTDILRSGRPAQGSSRPPVIFAFHVPWDKNSIISLKANSTHLTHVLAEWLIVQNGAGDLQDLTEIPVVEWSRQVNVPV